MKRNIKKSQKDKSTELDSAKEATSWASRPIFSGFIGGDVFVTKKGFRGIKMDTLWVQNLIEAFKMDDLELAAMSFESTLSDVRDVVVGGENGSPYSIGDYGFYVEDQFEAQYNHILANAKQWCLRNKHYLSGSEWEVMESQLSSLAHHGQASFYDTCRGDSFACLAVRYNAFQVAKYILSQPGLDPLLENEREQDLFQITKVQYGVLTLRLKEVQVMKQEAVKRVMVPSVIANIINEERAVVQQFKDMSAFVDELRTNFHQRLRDIEIDKMLKRQCELKNEEFPAQKSWNISLQPKIVKYLPEMDELQNFIDEKIKFNEIEASKFRNLSDVLLDNYSLIVEVGNGKNVMGMDDGDHDGTVTLIGLDGDTAGTNTTRTNNNNNKMPSIEQISVLGRSRSMDRNASLEGGEENLSLPSISTSLPSNIHSSSLTVGSSTTSMPPSLSIMRSPSKLSSNRLAMGVLQRTPTLKDKDDLFDALGMSEKSSFSNSNRTASSRLIALSTVEQYAPTQGVLRENETETIMYR